LLMAEVDKIMEAEVETPQQEEVDVVLEEEN
jgi:hypothetical protein